MPELPEVESFRRTAMRALEGQVLTHAWAEDDDIVVQGTTGRTLARHLTGRTVVGSGRKGKLMWLELDERPWPLFHFGMTGRFEAVPSGAARPRFTKLELTRSDGERLAFINVRRLGRLRLLDDPASEPPVSKLGFDPLDQLPIARELTKLLAKRKGPIKAVLLDQKLFAGVGNWIADEVLYQAGIAPVRPARELTAVEVKRLRTTLLRVIKRAVDVEADANRFPKSWLFHVRWGKQTGAKTHKGEPLTFDVVGGRTTAWVKSAQH